MPPETRAATVDLKRRFARLTVLNILTNVTVPLASLVDTALLGHLSDIRFLAGVALAAVIFEYLYWSFGFLRMGTTGTTARAWGGGDRAETYRVLYRSLLLALALGATLLVLQRPLAAAGFGLLAGEEGVQAAGRAYFQARIWGAPATLANFAFLGWYLGREESRHALTMTIAGNLANVALDFELIVRRDLAAAGAGAATAVSQYVMLAVAVVILLRGGPLERWRWREVAAPGAVGSLLRLNRDILLRTLALVTSFALFFKWSATLGATALAANAILYRLQTLAAYLIDGAAFALESLAGILSAQGRRRELARLLRLALATGVLFATLPLAALLLAPAPLFSLLTGHAETVALARLYAPWLVPVLLLGSVAFIYDGYFIGLTEGRVLRNSMLLATLGVFVPLGLVAAARASNQLLWLAMALFMLARAATLAGAAHGRRGG